MLCLTIYIEPAGNDIMLVGVTLGPPPSLLPQSLQNFNVLDHDQSES